MTYPDEPDSFDEMDEDEDESDDMDEDEEPEPAEDKDRFRIIHEQVVERLFEAINAAKLTPAEFFQHTGVNHATLAHWKRGSRLPSVGHIVVLAEFLKVDIAYLMTGKSGT